MSPLFPCESLCSRLPDRTQVTISMSWWGWTGWPSTSFSLLESAVSGLARLLYDTAAHAREILALDVDHLDLPRRRAVVIGKDARAELGQCPLT
ncbi:MAG: hypothetical protein ACRDRW_03945 [Pseudonocardiaceae bacterium]